MGATYGALLGSLSSSLMGVSYKRLRLWDWPQRRRCVLSEPSLTSPSPMVRAGRCWPYLSCYVGLTRGNRPVSLGYSVLSFRLRDKIGEETSRKTGSAEYQSYSRCIYSGYRGSLGDGDRGGGHIRDLTFERVARFPPLYPTGNSDINSPFEIEFIAWFDGNE